MSPAAGCSGSQPHPLFSYSAWSVSCSAGKALLRGYHASRSLSLAGGGSDRHALGLVVKLAAEVRARDSKATHEGKDVLAKTEVGVEQRAERRVPDAAGVDAAIS